MKIKFTKLPTTDGVIKVSLDGGQSFTDYNVADKNLESGISLSDNQDYEKIQIKGPANILKNLDIVSSVKIEGASGGSSINEYEIYTATLYIYTDYGNLYVDTDCVFSSNNPEMFIFYNGTYYKLGDTSDCLERANISDFNDNYIKLNDEIVHVKRNFYLSNGQFSDSDADPEGLVNILTYEKGVGGTATIKGIEVDYKLASSIINGEKDYSYYYWASPNISSFGNYFYQTKNGYKTPDKIAEELRASLLSNGPIDVYAKLSNGQYLKLPIKLS